MRKVSMFPNFDPSKMDPKLLMELSSLVRQLPPDKVMRMQSLMHNMMAGFDVRKDMEEFEKTLPPGFREKLVQIMSAQGIAPGQPDIVVEAKQEPPPSQPKEMNMREARLTLLRAVADGSMSPEEAERILFSQT